MAFEELKAAPGKNDFGLLWIVALSPWCAEALVLGSRILYSAHYNVGGCSYCDLLFVREWAGAWPREHRKPAMRAWRPPHTFLFGSLLISGGTNDGAIAGWRGMPLSPWFAEA
jgi:hypothetical protein